jgi:hypothetical protein
MIMCRSLVVDADKSEPEKRPDQPQKPIVEQMTDLAAEAAGALARDRG